MNPPLCDLLRSIILRSLYSEEALKITMSCAQCAHIVERPDLPHVIRRCAGCGRELRIHDPGKHGRGFKIEKGDRVVVPSEWLSLSFNPLKNRGTFSRSGLQWFAELVMLEEMPKKQEEFGDEIRKLEAWCDRILRDSKLLQGLDIDDEQQVEEVTNLLKSNRDTAEWWAFLVGVFLAIVEEAVDGGLASRAAWAMSCAERCRSMVIYKQQLEEVVWMGHSAKRIIDVLATWDSNKSNNDEEFWQLTFRENSYVLSQVFAVPVIFIQDKAYVGGMLLNRNEARYVDYLFSVESSQEAMLVEIKTPTMPLVGKKYRGIYTPSIELSGAIVQALDYRDNLIRNVERLGHKVSVFSPKCVVICGNREQHLVDEPRRKSFELFRSGLKDVEVVTYDELFRKVEILASLFNLSKNRSDS